MNRNFFDVAVQASSLGKEELVYECLSCHESISNPICPSCILKEFEVWVEKYPRIKKNVLPQLKKFLLGLNHFEHDSQTCVVCRKNSAYLCPYCFTEFILEILRENGTDKEVLKDYLQFFNFDFGDFEGKWGYYDVAEKLGLV